MKYDNTAELNIIDVEDKSQRLGKTVKRLGGFILNPLKILAVAMFELLMSLLHARRFDMGTIREACK